MECIPLCAGGRRLNRRKAKASLRALMELGKLYEKCGEQTATSVEKSSLKKKEKKRKIITQMPERIEAVSRLWDCGSPPLPFALCARHWLIRDTFLQQCAGRVCILLGAPPAAEPGAVLSPQEHPTWALQPCTSNPGGQVFSQADFQGLQAFLDAREYWTDASTVYSEFGYKVLKGGGLWSQTRTWILMGPATVGLTYARFCSPSQTWVAISLDFPIWSCVLCFLSVLMIGTSSL